MAGLRGLVSRNAHRARGLGGALSYFGQGGIDGQGNITANNLYQYCSVANVQRRVSRLSKGASRIPSAQEQLIKSLKADLEEAKQTAKEAKNVEAEKLRLQVQAIQNYKKNTAERLALMTEKLNRVQPEFAEDMARMKHLFDKQQAELDQAIAQASAGQQGSTGLQGLLQNALSGVAEGKSPLDAVTGGALNQNNTGAKSEEDRDVIYQTISRSAGLFHDAELLLQRCPCNAECGPEGLANAEGGENCQRAKEFYDMYTEKFDVAGNCGEQISTSSVSSVNRRRFGNKKNVNNRRSKSKRTK